MVDPKRQGCFITAQKRFKIPAGDLTDLSISVAPGNREKAEEIENSDDEKNMDKQDEEAFEDEEIPLPALAELEYLAV